MKGKNVRTKGSASNVNPVQRSVSSSSISSATSHRSQSPHLTSTSNAITTASPWADVNASSSLQGGNLVFMEKQNDKANSLTEQASIGLVSISTCKIPLPDSCLKPKTDQSYAKMHLDSSGESSQDSDSINTASPCSPQASNSTQLTCEQSQGASNLSHTNLNHQSNSLSKQRQPLRRGKWTIEEEEYVARAIQDFNNGYLKAPAGTTLRSYLSEKLNCDPMRITKKFTGDACIGKRIFHPVIRSEANTAEIEKAQAELDTLEKKWRKRVEAQQKDTSRRSHRCASSRVAVPCAKVEVKTAELLSRQTSGEQSKKKEVFTQTATWLDRAENILSSCHPSDVETQMKQVEALIHEGPLIHTSSAILSKLLVSSVVQDTLCHHRAPMDSNVALEVGTSTQLVQSKTQEESLPTKRKVYAKEQTCNEHTDDEKKCLIDYDSNAYFPKEYPQLLEVSNLSSYASGSDAEALVDFVKSLRNNTH